MNLLGNEREDRDRMLCQWNGVGGNFSLRWFVTEAIAQQEHRHFRSNDITGEVRFDIYVRRVDGDKVSRITSLDPTKEKKNQ